MRKLDPHSYAAKLLTPCALGLSCALALLACTGDAGDADDGPSETKALTQPEAWDEELGLVEAKDEDPRDGHVEITLRAQPGEVEDAEGRKIAVLTYDGHLPGPLIRARVGDRLTVHFQNELDVTTTVHWHGVRVPNDMDGVHEHTQLEVQPGGRFDYVFDLRDPGLFWYHPHIDSAVQVGSGLYGALLVEDNAEPKEWGDPLVLVLSDLAVDDEGKLRPGDEGGDTATLFGREGELLLVNGRIAPVLQARAGLRQRWRIVNAAKSRYMQLALDGHRFTRIGGDGGLLPRAIESDTVVLTPGQRIDVLVTPRGEGGERLPVRWVPYDRGYGSTELRDEETLFEIEIAEGEKANEEPPEPVLERVIEPLDITNAVTHSLELTQSEAGGPLELGINGVAAWDAPPMQARIGETHVWTVSNDMDWAHPFHLHGYFFQVLDQNGVEPEVVEWLDTVDVPVDESVRIAVHFDERPGMWMFHCHILDHADAGMMGMVHVAAEGESHDTSSHAGHMR